jgi:hypothetical protein
VCIHIYILLLYVYTNKRVRTKWLPLTCNFLDNNIRYWSLKFEPIFYISITSCYLDTTICWVISQVRNLSGQIENFVLQFFGKTEQLGRSWPLVTLAGRAKGWSWPEKCLIRGSMVRWKEGKGLWFIAGASNVLVRCNAIRNGMLESYWTSFSSGEFLLFLVGKLNSFRHLNCDMFI